jgi:hypothetical protein
MGGYRLCYYHVALYNILSFGIINNYTNFDKVMLIGDLPFIHLSFIIIF